MEEHPTKPSRFGLPICSSPLAASGLIALWIVAVSGALYAQAAYVQTNGDLAPPPSATPASLRLDPARHTLVMAIHPKCPCTRASLGELQRLQRKLGDRLALAFLIYTPPAHAQTWVPDMAENLGALGLDGTILPDPDGALAASLGCQTSGSVVLYDPSGDARFWGGITSGRGHRGDNLGSDAVLAIVRDTNTTTRTTPVYGCPLSTPDDPAPGAGPCADRGAAMCEVTP